MSQNNFTRFPLPINILFLNCQVARFFTDVVPKIAVHAVVQTTNQLVRGKIHVRQGERLKDELDHDDLFLAVTEATILGEDGQILFQAPFLAVRRSQIVWVLPDQEEIQGAP